MRSMYPRVLFKYGRLSVVPISMLCSMSVDRRIRRYLFCFLTGAQSLSSVRGM